jgi:hypothetical protein
MGGLLPIDFTTKLTNLACFDKFVVVSSNPYLETLFYKPIPEEEVLMKPYIKLIILFAALLFVVQGCYTLNQVGSPVDEGIEITNTQNAAVIKHFTRTKTVNHFVYGLVSPDDAGIERIVADAVKQNGGTHAVNVKLKYQQTFINGLVGGLTFGIYTPFTLTIEGDVAK